MRFRNTSRRGIALLAVALAGLMAIPAFAQTQAAGTADEWIIRLGDGTDYSRQRMEAGLAAVAPLVPELFVATIRK